MGMDLKLFPIEFSEGSGDWYARTVLELWRDYRVFDSVMAVKCHPVGPLKRVLVLGNEGESYRTEDSYGTPLTFALAGHLAAVKLPEDTAYWTQAAWAYLRALPNDTVIVLYWH